MDQFYTFVSTDKNHVMEIGYDENNKKYIKRTRFKPKLAILANAKQDHGFTTIKGKSVQFQQFDDIFSYHQYIRDYSDVFDIYNNIHPKYQFINTHYKNLNNVDTSKIRKFLFDIEAHSEPGEGFPDPKAALWPIRSIALHDSITDVCYLISLGPWDSQKEFLIERGVDLKKIKFKQCKSEIELFETLVKIFEYFKPDILSGWNSEGFDIPYILNRATVINFTDINRLSPFGQTFIEWKILDNGNTQYNCKILGIALLDYMKVYKKFRSGNKESYKLDFILEDEIGQNKIDFHEEGYNTFSDLWNKNPNLYNSYNIYDTIGMVNLENKLKLFDTLLMLAYKAKCNFEETLGTIAMWDVYMYNYLWNQKVVIPPKKNNERASYPGAFVQDPVPGLYKWVFSVDLNSLYPHIMQQINISPDCIVDAEDLYTECYNTEYVDLKEQKMILKDMHFFIENEYKFTHIGENIDGMVKVQTLHPDILNGKIRGNRKYILAPNGTYFRKDKEGFVSILMKTLYSERKLIKKEMLQHEQELENCDKSDKDKIAKLESLVASKNSAQIAIKLLINSWYGAYANPYCRYYDIRCATAITLFGQLANRWIANVINDKLKHDGLSVIYQDTDSVDGSSIINTSKGDIKIEDFYKNCTDKQIKRGLDNFVKKISSSIYGKSLNTTTEKIENKKIKYIMKHKVKKRMFRVKSKNKFVNITKDHSIIIKRGNKIIQGKPTDIKPGDKVCIDNLNIKFTSDFEIEDLGIQEKYVYDIEIEDNHNFFANDILVHNSDYVHFEPVMEKIIKQDKTLLLPENRNILIDKADEYIKEIVIPVIENGFEDLKEYVNANENRMFMEREVIATSMALIKKKKYFMNVSDSEGIRYEIDHFKARGIALVQRSTPKICKDPMKKSLKMMLMDHAKLSEFIIEFRNKFYNSTPDEVGATRTINDILKWKTDTFPYYISGTPAHARGAILYNMYIKKQKIEDEYEEILSGESAKSIYMLTPNPVSAQENIVSFLNGRFPDVNDLSKYVDYATMFEKTFFKTINDTAKSLGITINITGESDIDDLEW